MVQQVTGVVVLLVLGVELPVVPLGPLEECLPRVVLHPSILPSNLFPLRRSNQISVIFVTSLKATLTVFTFLTWLEFWSSFTFHSAEEKKFFLTSSLTACQCCGSGSESGSGSTCFGPPGSFYHQAKKSKKNLDSYCFVTFFDFLTLKMMYM